VNQIIILVIETQRKFSLATRTAYIPELQGLTISDKSEDVALLYSISGQATKEVSIRNLELYDSEAESFDNWCKTRQDSL
jgi:predicted ATP-dependent serine protease